MKLSSLGEFGLIERLSKIVGKPSKSVVVGIGDDTAVFRTAGPPRFYRGKTARPYLLVTTDTLIENVHFKVGRASSAATFFDLGYKALAINISDIAAMGGYPTYALVTIGANKNLSVEKVEELYRGMQKLAKKYKIEIIGGDTVQSPKELIISIALLGEVKKECLLTRSGARVGDAIMVTGDFGGPASRKFVFRLSSFVLRLKEARAIAKSGLATSMIDSSDGMVRSVMEICKRSKVGARLWLDLVPIAEGATLEQALYGGEEYELIFTVPKNKVKKLKCLKVKMTVVGEIVAKKQGIKLVDIQGRVFDPKSGGYEHFRN